MGRQSGGTVGRIRARRLKRSRANLEPRFQLEYEERGSTGQIVFGWEQALALHDQLGKLIEEGRQWEEQQSGRKRPLPGEQPLIDSDGVTLTIEPESSTPSEPEALPVPQLQGIACWSPVLSGRTLVDALGCVGFAGLPAAGPASPLPAPSSGGRS